MSEIDEVNEDDQQQVDSRTEWLSLDFTRKIRRELEQVRMTRRTNLCLAAISSSDPRIAGMAGELQSLEAMIVLMGGAPMAKAKKGGE